MNRCVDSQKDWEKHNKSNVTNIKKWRDTFDKTHKLDVAVLGKIDEHFPNNAKTLWRIKCPQTLNTDQIHGDVTTFQIQRNNSDQSNEGKIEICDNSLLQLIECNFSKFGELVQILAKTLKTMSLQICTMTLNYSWTQLKKFDSAEIWSWMEIPHNDKQTWTLSKSHMTFQKNLF